MEEFRILKTANYGEAYEFVYGTPEEDFAVADGNYDDRFRTLTYRIKTKPDDEAFFEFTVEERGHDRLCVTMMNNHDREEYTSKGIPGAMILMLAKTSGKIVTSSSNRNGPREYRTPPATKIWQKLVEHELARYHVEEDRFYANGPVDASGTG